VERLPPPCQQLIYEYDDTYRRVFNLTLLNLELLMEVSDDLATLWRRLRQPRFEMEIRSGVVWERRPK
jgi:hypothetical protein